MEKQAIDIAENFNLIDFENELPFYSILRSVAESSSSKPKKQSEQIEKNIPMVIKDILQLNIDEDNFGKNLVAYGVKFETVMIYGTCTPMGNDYKTQKLKYSIDDGTGIINVKCPYQKSYNDAIKALRTELKFNQNEVIEELSSSLSRILTEIEKNACQPDIHYESGSRVCIIGVPYKIFNQIWIHVYEMTLDQGQIRDKEIFFKNYLIRFFTNHNVNLNAT